MYIKNLGNLKGLGYHKQLAFAYLACERLYPNYVHFSNKNAFGDPAILKEAIQFVRAAVLAKNINQTQRERLLHIVNEHTPLPEDFGTALASAALDATSVIFHTLDFMSDQNAASLEDISNAATDSVHIYIQENLSLNFQSPDFENIILQHPLMLQEVHIQEGIITYLSKIGEVEEDDLETLMAMQDKEGKGNLGL
ncbi:YjaG family protein [Chitinophaga horti]|uniref:YjaG family protein n=1 Tax=Chitinophaga horti TaxID=2920382 RepID=A0ABY6IUY4_9BACT|nr:YjaG family protein [Chitinophaga horti]UYQ91178.1 YjaG family protein [Chitinophaga horti]